MSNKSYALLGVTCLGLVDAVVPFFPIIALILVYVVLEKPTWFLQLVDDVYHRH